MSNNIAPLTNYIIKNKSKFIEEPSPAHVQNILYYAHGVSLAKYDKPLLRCGFAAYKFGAINLELDTETTYVTKNKEIKRFLDMIILNLRKVKEEELSKFIRKNDSPWKTAINGKILIDNNEIKEYFNIYLSKYPNSIF